MNGGFFMKKTVISFLIAGVLISAGSVSALAAGSGSNYTDSDRNGVCDYAEARTISGTASCGMIDCTPVATGAVCSAAKAGANYTDADNDGICDNYTGSGKGSGYGCGNGSGYSDANNDGVCDNYSNRSCPRNGTGNQHGKNR